MCWIECEYNINKSFVRFVSHTNAIKVKNCLLCKHLLQRIYWIEGTAIKLMKCVTGLDYQTDNFLNLLTTWNESLGLVAYSGITYYIFPL